MVTGSLRVLALSFTLMAVPAEYAPLSFPPVWSGILELNQEPQSYQDCALTDCANARYSPDWHLLVRVERIELSTP